MTAVLNRRTRRAIASAARKAAPRPGRGAVIERLAISESGASPLRVDHEAGIIYGVKVYGLHSPNSHGRPGVSGGTDYPIELHRRSLSIFEGATVFGDHPADRREANKVRKSTEAVGVLKKCEVRQDGTYANLHLIMSSDLGPAVLEDAEKALGVYALSINAMPGRERVAGGKLIIEQFDFANSVDVVTRGGTNKTLWESQERTVNTTLKAILEAWVKAKSPAHKKYARALLEDDAMPMGDTPVETDATAEPEDELWSGFKAAIMAIIDGDGDATAKAKQIAKYLKAHEKLSSDSEPEPEEPVEEEDDSDDEKPKGETKEAREVKTLRAKVACLEAGVEATPELTKALGLMESDTERKALLSRFGKSSGPVRTGPKSGAPGAAKKPSASGGAGAGGAVTEAKIPKGADFRKSIGG
jgi:hypothetical protein